MPNPTEVPVAAPRGTDVPDRRHDGSLQKPHPICTIPAPPRGPTGPARGASETETTRRGLPAKQLSRRCTVHWMALALVGAATAPLLPTGQACKTLDAGMHSTCAIVNSGRVKCWGYGTNGGLGYGNTNDIGDNELPSSVGFVDVGGNATQVTVGDQLACVLLTTN